jgi:hypothetical protein
MIVPVDSNLIIDVKDYKVDCPYDFVQETI